MSYATQSDMVGRYGLDEIVARTNRAGGTTVDTSVLARALADAEAEINGYLATRYKLPLPTVPPLLVRLACDIARYRLWEDIASEEVRLRYEDARHLLGQIARGTVSLGLPADLPSSQRPVLSMSAAKSGPKPVFDADSMRGF